MLKNSTETVRKTVSDTPEIMKYVIATYLLTAMFFHTSL